MGYKYSYPTYNPTYNYPWTSKKELCMSKDAEKQARAKADKEKDEKLKQWLGQWRV